MFQEAGYRTGELRALSGLGEVYFVVERYDEALSCYRACLDGDAGSGGAFTGNRCLAGDGAGMSGARSVGRSGGVFLP
jgi:hypothetical protein